MKTKLIWFSVLILSLNTTIAQWNIVNTGNYTWSSAWAIDACDSATAVISVTSSTAGSLILLTTDAGISWKNLNWPNYKSPYHLSIKDANHIWAGLSDGRIIATSDGGNTWQVQFSDSTKTHCINYVEMFNPNDGVAMGDAIEFGAPESIFFINENVGWVVGSYLWKTTDGGTTWNTQEKFSPDFVGENIYFTDENNGWINGDTNQNFYRTTNGGSSWQFLRINIPSVEKFYFQDNVGWTIGGSTLMKTTNSGETWVIVSSNDWIRVRDFSFITKDIGWTSAYISTGGNHYVLMKTTNGGSNWSEIKSFADEPIYFVHFANENIGWVISKKIAADFSAETFISYTSDAGITWTKTKITDSSITKYQFIPYIDLIGQNKFLIICSGSDFIFRSNDNGTTWEQSNINFEIRSIYFVNEKIGFAGSSNQRIFKSTDSGNTWTKLNEKSPTQFPLLKTTNGGNNWTIVQNNYLGWRSSDVWRKIDFVNPEKGFVVPSSFLEGDNLAGYTVKTENGGLNFSKLNIPRSVQVLKFYNENYGVVCNAGINSSSFKIFRTTNGGISFDSVIVTGTSGWGSDIEFLPGSPSNVWFSSGKKLFFSSDSAKTWTDGGLSLSIPWIRDIVFINKRIGWALSDNAVYKTENNAGLVTSVDNKNFIPTKFTLDQNYPNPFNPETVISYQLAVNSFVSLKIYDLLGREVATLVDDYKQPGYYNSKFSIANNKLSSGVYYYTLKTGNYVETKKMVLMK